jgi:hypothetical protein
MCILETEIIYNLHGQSKADSHWPHTVETWAESQVSPVGFVASKLALKNVLLSVFQISHQS